MSKSLTFPECWTDDRRMKVLFSPLRKRDVNPENYDGQVLFWKNQIKKYAECMANPRVNFEELREAFMRNGDKPHCLIEVLESMMAAGDIKLIDQFMQDTSNSGWGAWSMQKLRIGAQLVKGTLFKSSVPIAEASFVVMDVVNSQADAMIRSLKNQILSRADVKKRISEWNISEEALPLVLFELHCRQRVVTQHLHDDDHPVTDDDERTVLKFGTESHKAFTFTDIELSIHKLEFTERNLLKMIGRMEEQVHEHEEVAKKLLTEKKRVLAKNSLRKRDAMMKRLEKRVQCLENVQTLVLRIHEVTDDAKVLDAYRTGTKSLQMALDKSGITLDTVDEAITKMQDVIELHDEIKNAIATGGVPAGEQLDDTELERELEELVAEEKEEKKNSKVVEENKEKEEKKKENENDLMRQLENLTIVSDPLPSSSPEKGKDSTKKEEPAMCL